MNVGAFDAGNKSGSWGFLIQNSERTGFIVGVANQPPVHNALYAETEACLLNLQVAIAHGISHVYVETDSLPLVTTHKSLDSDLALGGIRFRELRLLIHFDFAHVDVSFSPRRGFNPHWILHPHSDLVWM